MKQGNKYRSIDKPIEGFSFIKEGYKIYISYIEPDSISEIDVNYNETPRKEYEYTEYNYCGSIENYEELVSKSILLKYTIESELSLMVKAINDSTNQEYIDYRNFVELCKTKCNEVYKDLGLNKEEI